MLSPCVLGVAFCESVADGDVANVLFCRDFVVGCGRCGAGVLSADVTSMSSIPAASTIFEKRNSLLAKGVALFRSEPALFLR